MSKAEAQTLTDRIRDGVEDLKALVVQAHESRAWAALGYESWDEYLQEEFDGPPLLVQRAERPELVTELRDEGMSTRAIASTTGNVILSDAIDTLTSLRSAVRDATAERSA